MNEFITRINTDILTNQPGDVATTVQILITFNCIYL